MAEVSLASPSENNIVEGTVHVEYKADASQVENEENTFTVKPIAVITHDASEATETVNIDNNQLNGALIKVTIPVTIAPVAIIHRDEDGNLIETFDKDHFDYDSNNKTCSVLVSRFSILQAVDNKPDIDDVDAYIDNEGLGNIRFLTTVYTDSIVTGFGTWVVTAGYLNDNFEGSTTIKKADKSGTATKFYADLMRIPATNVSDTFYAKSYITIGNTNRWSDVKSATIEQYKNSTSK